MHKKEERIIQDGPAPMRAGHPTPPLGLPARWPRCVPGQAPGVAGSAHARCLRAAQGALARQCSLGTATRPAQQQVMREQAYRPSTDS